MSEPDSADTDLLDRLTDDFVSRVRRGESPDPEEYARAHPRLADRIRRMCGALLELEGTPRTVSNGPGGPGPGGPPLTAPEVLGNFRLLREIGRGGMGVVYEAEQAPLGRRVALKVMSRGAASGAAVERFRREAAVTAGLDHPNIVTVFEAGQHGDLCYFAMPFVDGSSLDRLLRAGSAGPAGAGPGLGDHLARARLILQAARALAHAHAQGLVHRDIKPGNLLLDRAGVLRVADFGLVKVAASELTESGMLVGTLRYLAPEHLQGRCDARSDVYSLGLTFYELLTGRPAFDQGQQYALLEAVRSADPPAPRSIDPTIPRDLETIVLAATRKAPEERYASAQALADDLERVLAGERPRRLPRRRRRGPVLVGVVALLLALGLLAGWRLAGPGAGQAGTPAEGPDRPAPPAGPEAPEAPKAGARRAAEWVLDCGGSVKVAADGPPLEVRARKDLPAGPFRLLEANLQDLGARVTDAGLANLKEARDLAVLHLVRVPLTDAGLAHLAGLTELTQLSLIEIPASDDGLAFLANLKRLRWLNLQKTRLTDRGMALVGDLPELGMLYLADNAVTDAGLRRLKHPGALTNLGLSMTQVTGTGLGRPEAFPFLKEVDLSLAPATDDGLRRLARLPGLTHLKVSNSQVTDAGVAALAGDRLFYLDLGKTKVTDDGLAPVGKLTGLAWLMLGGTAVTDAGLAHLTGLRQLVTLQLGGTRVTPAGVKRLKQALPGCTVMADFPAP